MKLTTSLLKQAQSKQLEKREGMHSPTLSESVRVCSRGSHNIIHSHAWSSYPFGFHSSRQITIAPKKAPLRFRSPIRTKSHTKTENQESQQTTVSATEFNEMKNELKNLTHLMIMMMGRFENQTRLPAAQDSGSPQGIPLNEAPNFQTQNVLIPSV